jgi:purine catabolism regulator
VRGISAVRQETEMGIAIQELLSQEYFKDFYVLAGAKGLHREIQGITVMEAPDAFHWTKGKELVLSSGYVIAKEPDCIEKAFREGSIQKSAGMMIKRERYLEKIPEEILELFDQYEVPLISMPFSAPWMEVMSQINTAVLNRTIRRLRINTSHMTFQMSNFSYKEQKIKRILQAMEAEMGFPAFLYDFVEEEAYYSSMNFQKIAKGFGLETEDFWEPSMPYTRHTLCDYMDMVRYRLVNQSHQEGPRISWIRVPISVNGSVQAYFAVMEAREFLDYYDEYSIRIAYLMLQGLYEQIVAAQNMGNIGFENFIHLALDYTEKDAKKLFYQANIQGISVNTAYQYIVFHQCNEGYNARNERNTFLEAFQQSKLGKIGKIAFLDENDGLILLEAEKIHNSTLWTKDTTTELLKEFQRYIGLKFADMKLEFGICQEEKTLLEVRECVKKCQKVLKMGSIIFPEKDIWEYEMLGPLTWIEIPENELKEMLRKYREMMEEEKNIELLKTLKIYLENNMNYSVTAEKMYVHINTIRKRIDKVNDLVKIDWEDHVDRLKMEILLQFLGLEE